MPIQPDTKDWTWVLQRSCPECGFDAAAVPRDSVSARVRQTLPRWQAALAASGAAARPSPDVWSTLEYGCHVRDVFALYDYRLGLMLGQDDPAYPNWDQDETAVAERYAEQDPVQVALELAAAGEAVATSFDGVTGDAWERTGRRSDGAVFTVDTFSRYFLHDVEHHLWDVTR